MKGQRMPPLGRRGSGGAPPGARAPRLSRRHRDPPGQELAQFKIGVWLAEQGIELEDIAGVELLGLNEVKIINPAGQYMIVRWVDDHPEIDRT